MTANIFSRDCTLGRKEGKRAERVGKLFIELSSCGGLGSLTIWQVSLEAADSS